MKLWDDLISRAEDEGRTFLMEHECKELLERQGIATTGAAVARSPEEAVELAERIGYPVVLKVLSPEVVHKSDAGGVKLNLKSGAAVERAYREIERAFAGKKLIGAAVQQMAPPGLEVIIGVSTDPTFGPVLMFGLGGVFVEVLQDVSFRILPVSDGDIGAMIEEIRGYTLLKGYRGSAVDLPALKGLLRRVSRLVDRYPQIEEIDLNPVFLYEKGNITVDARIFLAQPGAAAAAPPERRSGASLRGFFYPESLAVIGASDTPGKLGWNVFNNLLRHRYPGRLYPVNIKAKTVQGVPAVANVGEIEAPVEAAVILVPAAHTLQAFRDCCEKGIRHIVIESAGFAETGAAGEDIERELRELAKIHNCRFIGPNCSGIINTHHRMVQSIGVVGELRRGNIGLIAQAGVYAAGMLWGLRQIMDFAIVATIGNKADLNETDILEYLGEDDAVEVICMYLEDVKSGRRFIDTARRVSAKKPVIILKAGRTEAGKIAVTSHTASLAGDDRIYDAAFRQAGVIRARNNEEMFGLARAFSRQPLPPGDGTLVVTYTGSLGVATADALTLGGLRLAELDAETHRRLEAILPPYVGVQNPVDCTFDLDPPQLREIIAAGLQSSAIGSFIVVLQAELLQGYVGELKEIDFRGRPLLVCVPCKEFAINEVIAMEQAGFPVYTTPEGAVAALSAMQRFILSKVHPAQ
jgi:acyl-CoA synthetase (NDP forming)